MTERSVKVTLSAQVQGYIEGMQKAAQATRDTGSESEKLAKHQEAFQMLGRSAMVAGGLVAGGMVAMSKAAIDWDTAWAGVTKTVDGTDAELAAVESGLRDLAAVLPASHTEIAAVAEAAGQLGIQTDNVVAFTRTMVDLGETTNLTSDQAATALARFMNVMGTSQSQVSNLGSALVDLGNNYATTEAEILEMAQRLSGAGAQIGMSEGQVLGLSTALSSVGIEAEAGGSAMSKVMIDIASSVDKGGERLEQFAQVAGVSAEAFAQQWRTNPGEALASFVRGLADAEAQGKSTFGILEELGITEVRMRDALLRSASAADQFSTAMLQGNSAFSENTALMDEAEKRYETTAAQLDMMANRVVDAAISIGAHFLPAIEAGAEGVGNFADVLSGLDGPMGGVVAWGGALAGGALLGWGAFMTAIPQIAKYREALVTLDLAGGRLEKTLGFLGKAAGVAAAAGLVMAFAREAEADVTKLENSLKRSADATEMLGNAAEAQQNRGWGEVNLGLRQVKVDADAVAEAFEYLQNKADKGLFAITPMNLGDIQNTLGSLELVGDEMAKLAEADLPKMQSGLQGLSDEFGWTADEQWRFIENSPSLKSALEDQAGGLGLSTEKADLLQIAFGGVSDAALQGAAGTEEQTASLDELQGVAATTKEEVQKLADEIRNFGSAQFDVEESAISFQEALAGLDEQMSSGTSSLDIQTEAGRATQSAMLDVASAANENAAAIAAMGGDTEAIQPVLEAGRQKIIESRMALDESEDAAKAYADRLIATPASVETQVNLYGVEAAKAALAGYQSALSAVIGTASMAVEAVISATKPNANGGMYEYANGGIESYANGGMPTGIYPGGRPLYKFAEPETQWEAFISGKPDQRDRNRQIWMETGERLGMVAEIQKAIGGAGRGPAVNVSQTINPAPGMSEAQIGNAAAAKVSWAMRRRL